MFSIQYMRFCNLSHFPAMKVQGNLRKCTDLPGPLLLHAQSTDAVEDSRLKFRLLVPLDMSARVLKEAFLHMR